MKNFCFVLMTLSGLCLLAACGGGSTPSPLATHFSVTAPAAATAGTAFNFTVTALDASNNTVTAYSGTVHFTSTDGQAVLPTNSTLTNGTGTFPATLNTAGNQTISATDTVTVSITGSSSSISVSAGPAAHFSFTVPSTATAGTVFSLTVAAQDAFNNKATSYSGTMHFTSTDGQAVLPPNSTLTNGTGIFSATLNTAGGQTITATDTVTASITGTSNSINVIGPTTHLSVIVPAAATAGTSFSFTVTALDAANNVVGSYPGTVRFTSSDTQAVLPANSTLTNGTGTFSATLKTSGSQSITATDTVTTSISGTSSAISVSGPATHFSVTAPAAATVGITFSFSVFALDASNNLAASYPGTVHFTSTDGQAVLPPNASLTNGSTTFSATLKTLGSQTIKATDTVTASITGTSNSISVGTNAATHLSVAAPASAVKAKAFQVTVTALDAANNTSTTYSGTVQFTSSDGQAVLPANSPLTSGTAPFMVTLSTVGLQTITATDTVTASITGTSNRIMVFASCIPKGSQCGRPNSPPCCPGSTCAAQGDREYCVGTGDVLPAAIEPGSLDSGHASRFTATCTMESAREWHSATLLSDGLVLLTGGDNRTLSLATAELFNPDSRSFAPVGDMANARARHTATLLAGGAVLVTGGRDADGNALATAELFNPANVSFAPTGSMTTARESHTATLLRNGKVLISGGDNGRVTLATGELFDPTSGSFTPTGSMDTPRGFHTATLLKNGKVLVIGGRDPDGHVLATAELFDPTNGSFTPEGSLHTPRESHTATLLSDGKVLITGGDNGTESLATAELFDPISGSFTPTGGMQTAREFHTATLLNDGTVLVAGGAAFASIADGSARPAFLPESTATAELFNPASGSFTPTSDMTNARARHTAILLPDGEVLVTGGINPDLSALADSLASAEQFK